MNGEEALRQFEDLFEHLQTSIIEKRLADASLEDLETLLAKHEEQAEKLNGKISKVRDELEVKREMEKEEDRLRAEQERLDRAKGQMRKKAEERMLKRKRKLDGDSDLEEVKVKRERM